MDIDAIIAESASDNAAQNEGQVQETETKDQDTAKEEDQQNPEKEATEQEAETEHDEEQPDDADEQEAGNVDAFPKKAVNAINRRERRINKLQALLDKKNAELEKFKSSNFQNDEISKTINEADDKPNENDFADKPYSEYLDALTDWKVKHELKARDAKQAEELKKKDAEFAQQEKDKWITERAEKLDASALDAKKHFRDFDNVVADAMDGLEVSNEIKEVFLEADNAAYALYAMAKEGKIDEIADMKPNRAALEIGRYVEKGIALSKKQQTTNAPTPIKANKGVGVGSKALSDKNGDELLNWVNS